MIREGDGAVVARPIELPDGRSYMDLTITNFYTQIGVGRHNSFSRWLMQRFESDSETSCRDCTIV